MDSLKKLEELNKINEGLFDKIFKKNKQQPEQEPVNVLTKDSGVGFRLNGNYIEKLYGTDPYALSQNTWNLPEYKWLYGCEFEADAMHTSREGLYFSGKWESGEFKGYEFMDTEDAMFLGGKFNGEIYGASYDSFKINPWDYLGGTFEDAENGVLGKKPYSREIKNTDGFIEIIRIPLNWYVTIKGDKGKAITFKVVRKLVKNGEDGITTIDFQVLPGNNIVRVNWLNIIKDYNNFGFIRKGANFNVLGTNLTLSKVNYIVLSDKMENIQVSQKTEINFSKDKKLKPFIKNIPKPFNVIIKDGITKLNIDTFVTDINNGSFYKKLYLLKEFIKNGHVDGYISTSYIHLSPIFGKKGTLNPEEVEKNVIDIMHYFDNFMKFVAFEIKNEKIKNAIIKSMKEFLEIENTSQQITKNVTQNPKNQAAGKQIINALGKKTP